MKLANMWYSIDRTTTPAASICRIDYSVDLKFSATEIQRKAEVEVWCELWGHNVFLDEELSAVRYDTHIEVARPDLRIQRYFPVNCKLLHEDIVGKSEIYLKLKVLASGELYELVSEQIRDYF